MSFKVCLLPRTNASIRRWMGLRAVAVLMVFCMHYLDRPAAFVHWGWMGVDIFFVLSGFLITGILYDTRTAQHRYRNFYVRRSLRIFPLYYAVLLGALLLTPVFRWQWHPVWYLWPIYLGNYGRFLWLNDFHSAPHLLDHMWSRNHHLLFHFGHFWSLCIEEQFYMAWPLVVYQVKDRVKLRNICVVAIFLAILGRVACVLFLPHDLLVAGFIETGYPVAYRLAANGRVVALCLRGPEAARIARFAMPAIWVPVSVFVAMQAYFLAVRGFTYQADAAGWWSGPGAIGYALIDLFAAGVILRTIDSTSVFFRVLKIRPLRRLGQISYGFYVLHDIPHDLYTKLATRALPNGSAYVEWLTPTLALIGTTAAAYLSFRFFEAPFLRLKERFTVS